jgi:hypothetical protein
MTVTITPTMSPADLFSPMLVEGRDVGNPSRNVFHDILNREDPDLSLRPAGASTGTLVCVFPWDDPAAPAARATMRTASTFDYVDADHPSLNMRFGVDGPIRFALDSTRAYWLLEIPFREVYL